MSYPNNRETALHYSKVLWLTAWLTKTLLAAMLNRKALSTFKPLRLLTVKLFDFPCFSPLKCEVPVKPVKKNKAITHTISLWLAKRSARWNGSQTEKQRRPSPQHPQQPAPSMVFKKTRPSLNFGSSLRPKWRNAVA